MKKISLIAMLASVASGLFSQNVGIGTTTPSSPLHIKSLTSSNPLIIDGGSGSYYSILEGGLYRGYWGSFAGNPEDVDFGTGSGTTGKVHLTIQAVPKLTIDNTGNVGIGTTSPTKKLHVAGDSYFGGDIFIQTSLGHLGFGFSSGNQWAFPTVNSGADFRMQTSTDGTTFTSQHYFQQNGDIGFGTGTAAPVARLDIKSSTASSANSAMMIRNSTGDTLFRIRDNGYVGIGYNGTSYGRPLNIEGTGANFYYNASTFGGAIFPQSDNSLVIWSASSGTNKNVALNPGWGTVTVGTYTPATGYMLSIDGKAICNELKVQLTASWPDYVFSGDYKLPSLEDLEQSINLNKHLPNIPSSADIIADKGFEVGDMNRRLLEKVEELTLYIIELNKKNTALTEKMEQIEKQIPLKQ